MVYLKEINLVDTENQRKKVVELKAELEKESKKLKDMLVNLNLEYYGTIPKKYFESIKKDYVTEDGYSVKIEKGRISITRRIQSNLMATWMTTFDERTEFSPYHIVFSYESGRHIESTGTKNKMFEKYKDEVKRIEEIFEEEKHYDPFISFREFYGFLDFFK